jgi:hypothetical protein
MGVNGRPGVVRGKTRPSWRRDFIATGYAADGQKQMTACEHWPRQGACSLKRSGAANGQRFMTALRSVAPELAVVGRSVLAARMPLNAGTAAVLHGRSSRAPTSPFRTRLLWRTDAIHGWDQRVGRRAASAAGHAGLWRRNTSPEKNLLIARASPAVWLPPGKTAPAARRRAQPIQQL